MLIIKAFFVGRINPDYPTTKNSVIPAKAGIQLIEQPTRSGTEPRYCPLRVLFVWLDSRLRGNDEPWDYLGLSIIGAVNAM